jgi:hypothetical protein
MLIADLKIDILRSFPTAQAEIGCDLMVWIANMEAAFVQAIA